MQHFAESFLLLFLQVAVGGQIVVAATPFNELERGFYKSTGAVLFILGLLGLLGKIQLGAHPSLLSGHLWAGMEVLFYFAFLLSFALYLYTLWSDQIALRARTFSLSLLLGIAGLCLAAHSFHRGSFGSVETFLYPLSFVLSSLLLGGVTVGMLLGHWYLIDTGQSIRPFVRIFKFFCVALIAQTVFMFLMPLLLYLLGSPVTVASLKQLWERHFLLLVARIAVAQLFPLILSYMIWRTLKIPHTMAATGLFYIAMLGVFVGEILGRELLALTGLPF